MHPVPTELERLNPRRKKILRHSPFYILSILVYSVSDGRVARTLKPGVALSDWIAPAIIAAVAIGFWLWLGERDTMKSEDELAQRIRTDALANALPFTIGLAVLLLRLSQAGVRFELFPHSDSSWLLLLIPYGISLLVARRRYR